MLQWFESYETVDCLGGKAIKTHNGIIPMGNVDSFLSSSQLELKYKSETNGTADGGVADQNSINFILDPMKTQFDPIGSVCSDSIVEDRLDKLFCIESLGIEQSSCDYDEEYIEEFTSNISLIDGKYHVVLPWTDAIKEVPNNFHTAKKVLERVWENLNRTGYHESYEAVFKQQLEDDILEKVDLEKIDVDNHVFIPHRPVIKDKEGVTTKVRVVLNCSLRNRNGKSLNEAIYPGVNLLNDLVKILIRC